jgi:hypothetical protein
MLHFFRPMRSDRNGRNEVLLMPFLLLLLFLTSLSQLGMPKKGGRREIFLLSLATSPRQSSRKGSTEFGDKCLNYGRKVFKYFAVATSGNIGRRRQKKRVKKWPQTAAKPQQAHTLFYFLPSRHRPTASCGGGREEEGPFALIQLPAEGKNEKPSSLLASFPSSSSSSSSLCRSYGGSSALTLQPRKPTAAERHSFP